MNKYLSMLKYEVKNISRDKMNLVMIFYPAIMIALSLGLFPLIIKSSQDALSEANNTMMVLMLLIMILTLGSIYMSALLAFLFVEGKDEKTLATIATTPLNVKGYVIFKSIYTFIFSVLGNIIVLVLTKYLSGDTYIISFGGVSFNLFSNISIYHIIVFSIVNSLYMPAFALLLGGLAKNKIEAFAYVKGSGIVVMIPALIALPAFAGSLQYVLGILPNFWAAKGIIVAFLPEAMASNADLSFWGYMIIGAVFGLSINYPCYKLFLKKAMRV